jgi:hypothetical protein
MVAVADAGVTGIPRVVHFVHGLATSAADVQFGYEHYLAVVAAAEHIRPTSIVFHHHHRPSGPWWERAAPLLALRQIELPREIFGRPLEHAAHRADVVRLKSLLAEGGIYLDMDVLALRSFDELLDSDVPALGLEGAHGEHGLCNAVIVSPRDAPFLARWLDAYRTFDGSQWAEHSVALPLRLARAAPGDVRQLEARAFFWPLWDDAALRRLLLYGEYDFARNYATHLWSQAARPYVLSAWSPRFVAAVPSSLNCRTRALPRPAGARALPRPLGDEPSGCGCGGVRAPAAAYAGARAPLHRWPLTRAAAFAHADDDGGAEVGDASARSAGSLCFARDVGGGCAHCFFFAEGCAADAATEPGAAHFAPHAPAWPSAAGDGGDGDGGDGGVSALKSSGARVEVLTWTRGLEGLVALDGGWAAGGSGPAGPAEGFSLSWWAAALGQPEGGDSDGGGESGGGDGTWSGGGTWWSLVFEGGGQLSVGLEAPCSVSAADAPRVLEPVVRTRGLRAAPLSCGGLRAGVGVAADGGWHSFALHAHAREGMLSLAVDGAVVARTRWTAPSAARVVGLWLGTTEPPIAGRARPLHAVEPRRRSQLAELRIYAPALRGASEEAEAHAPPDAAWAHVAAARAPLLALPAERWAAALARGGRQAPCDLAAGARARPVASALSGLAWAVACAALCGWVCRRWSHARARASYRRVGGGGPPEPSKAN